MTFIWLFRKIYCKTFQIIQALALSLSTSLSLGRRNLLDSLTSLYACVCG